MLGVLFLADVETSFSLFGVLVILTGYLMPAIFGRDQQNARAIFFINLLLGWTIIGWLIALHFALKLSPTDKEAIASHQLRRHRNNLIS
ncbi:MULTISPECIES: superinfection immunity protein [Hymenobacter]|uniref:Superinfection immunity protein n=1 Tax=Hymenobacter mucosus TaxID=1411120 RepID=A0A238ZQA6_9BACT|nr:MULTISPECIES: superinfection immunity protein [Hymenobacter]SNR85587.1 Superinfection immunity protein [Hymenobacter mucosus]